MSTNAVQEKKEKSMIELLAIVTVIALLMAVFISYFFKNEQQFTHTGFMSLANKFSAKVQVVRAQWLMDNQPQQVILKNNLDNYVEKVTVNKKGWIDSSEHIQPCQHIWQMVLAMPAEFMRTPVTIVQIKAGELVGTGRCRFQIASQQYFDYTPANGKVVISH